MGHQRGPVRVVLIDDTPDFRLLMRTALAGSDAFEVVGEAGDGAAGVALVTALQPDAVLLDLTMPTLDGLAALPQLRVAAPRARVVVVSGVAGPAKPTAALAAGAAGFVPKSTPPDRIVEILADAVGGAATGADAAPALPDSEELTALRAALATAAHELRSPATILAGLSQTLRARRADMDDATVDQLLDAIVRQAGILDRVTADLLTTSQLHRGTVSVDARPMELAPVLDAAVVGVAHRGPVGVDCPADVTVVADRVRVEQMLSNLLTNAFNYGREPVRIVVEQEPRRAVVSVLDAGPGVPAAFRSLLFDQYSRGGGSRVAGSGIGLFVVRSLAQAQGGDAWYQPTPEGCARFRFALPLAGAAVPGAAPVGRRAEAGWTEVAWTEARG